MIKQNMTVIEMRIKNKHFSAKSKAPAELYPHWMRYVCRIRRRMCGDNFADHNSRIICKLVMGEYR